MAALPLPDFSVIYADDALLVLDKPAGLLSVPGRGDDKQDCLSRRVQQLYPDACIVHRLDMATSGLLVMARGSTVQRQLNAAFAGRAIHKRYEAVVDGVLIPSDPPDSEGWSVIKLPILLDWPNRPKSRVDAVHGKPSVTRWRVLATHAAEQTTRLALEPVTGRSHQLRLHLSAVSHPILGDGLYAPQPAMAKAGRLLLHATGLALPHPNTQEPMRFISPAPF